MSARAPRTQLSGRARCGSLLGRVLVLWLVLGVAAVAARPDSWAPFETPWFDQLTISDGLPHSVTTAVVQDREGLIWAGTMGGLVRYDGYRSQVFSAGTGQSHDLPDGYVRSLLALSGGGLLIGTNAGGLVRFNPANNSFHTYPIDADGLSSRKIYGLADDHAHGVWIATDRGLDHLNLRSGRISRTDTGPDTAPRNFSVMQDRQGNLWLGNESGLFVRRSGSSEFVRPDVSEKAASIVLKDQIWALLEDAEGRIWAGSVQAGAAYSDPDGSWHGVPGFSGYPGGVRHATVRSMIQTTAGTVWMATDGNGLIQYRAGAGAPRVVDHDPAVPSSLPGNTVRGLLQDRSGNVWAATDLGLARTNPQARTAFSLLPSPLASNALSDTNVHSVFVDSTGRIWIGLGGGHIDMMDLVSGRMRHLHLEGVQTRRDVRGFAETDDGTIWVGTQGLAKIHPRTLAITDSVAPALRDKPVISLAADGAHLLVGTYDGLFRFDTRSGTLDRISRTPNDPHSLAADTVRQMARIGDVWWFGTTRGLSIADGNEFPYRFINLHHRPNDPDSLPQNLIGTITQDLAGRVWVATMGGLAVSRAPADRSPLRFRTLGLADGLSSDKVSAALPDDHGRIWASLSNGVAMISADTRHVASLGSRDGLHIASYVNGAAAARAPDGSLLFGGQGGLTVIRPDQVVHQPITAPLAVTHVVVDGAVLPLAQLPTDGGAIEMEDRNHNLRIDFALLDYQAPTETAYSYRMDGMDESWTNIPKGSLPSAIYTSLPHGDYRLHLRATTHGLQPRTVETRLTIKVQPRWYETTLSRIIGGVLLSGLVMVLVHLRTLYLRRRATGLQRRVDERTRELLAANRRLDELASTDGLTGVYNRRRFLELAGHHREYTDHRPICIALFDLDRFKQINDTYGHLAGDAVICGAIAIIKQHCRQTDLVGRYGGEEFVVCLPDTDLESTREIAERICIALAASSMTYDGRQIRVTASIGIAALEPGESIERWLSRADQALYQAKRNGRNRCVAAA